MKHTSILIPKWRKEVTVKDLMNMLKACVGGVDGSLTIRVGRKKYVIDEVRAYGITPDTTIILKEKHLTNKN